MSHPTLVIGKPIVPSYSIIDTEWEKEFYWKKLMSLWGVRGRKVDSATFFPCTNPKSISKKLEKKLGEREYTICLKSDGVRYALMLTTRPNEEEAGVAVMVDRSRTMYEVDVLASEEYFLNGTVLE